MKLADEFLVHGYQPLTRSYVRRIDPGGSDRRPLVLQGHPATRDAKGLRPIGANYLPAFRISSPGGSRGVPCSHRLRENAYSQKHSDGGSVPARAQEVQEDPRRVLLAGGLGLGVLQTGLEPPG